MPRRQRPGLTEGIVTHGVMPPKLTRRGRRPLIPRVLTVHEAAAMLRMSSDMIRHYLKAGRLRGFRVGFVTGGGWRTTDLDVLAFMGFTSPGFPQIQPKPRADGRWCNGDGHRPQELAKARGEDPSAVAREMQRRGRANLRASKRLDLTDPPAQAEAAGPPA